MTIEMTLLEAMDTALENIKRMPANDYVAAVSECAKNPTCFGQALAESHELRVEGRSDGNQ